ncbi:MAG: S1C family serine protease, partial [Acidobacteria bacterium]|nr:S1C family serine protease [Acidobacteriota bacterium]
IISDINFNAGNSGGPLFNSIGEVVGVTTFKIKNKDGAAFTGNVIVDDNSGLAGIVRIEETAALIAKARGIAATKGTPSAELMPNIPEGAFPIETIKTLLKAPNFPKSQYLADVKNYQIKYMTPVFKFYVMEKDRIDSLKIREKRNDDKNGIDTADMFRDLRYWSQYAGELQPVVQILALPETGATGKSMLLSAVTAATIGISTPFDHKYKADFYQMKLMCDGSEVVPLRRNKTEIARDLQHYYKERRRYTYAGVYSYPYDVFAPGRCRQMQLQVFSEENIENPITTTVQDVTKNRVWSDFTQFRTQIAVRR